MQMARKYHRWAQGIGLSFIIFHLSASSLMAQDIASIAKSDPLIMTGSIGTANTYRYSSVGETYGSPLSNTIYANLNISLYGISMPFSFYYSNDNMHFNYPQFTFSLTPRYKQWTGHIGQSSMAFSPYIMNMSWTGVGLEYNTDKLRVGAFYGRLRKAVNGDPSDPLARSAQYRRMGWGFKVGYGTSQNYIDLYLLRAYDCLNSIDDSWHEVISPQENIVVGLKGCVTPFKWVSLTANVASSLFSTDTQAMKIEDDKAARWDNIFDVRYSSMMRFAGDATLNIRIPSGINLSLCYRMVQPDYTSLGTYYMSNNYQSLGVMASTTLFNKLALSGTFSGQSDNLTNKQMFTTSGYVYNVMGSMRFGKYFNLNAIYNGYTQKQSDGTLKVNDSTRVNRQLNSFTLTPMFMYSTEKLGHNISLTANYTTNKDLNTFTETINHSNITTTALGVSYSLNVVPWETDFGLTLSHQSSEGYRRKYRSDVGTLSVSRSFFADKNLHLSAAMSLCYNEVERESKNLSIGGNFSLGYTLKKVHSISAGASFNKYGDVNITKTRSNLDCTDITCSLNYVYTFSLFEIKRRQSPSAE